MKAFQIAMICITLMIFGTRIAQAQLHLPEVGEKESGMQQIKYIESGKILYNYSWESVATKQGEKTVVKVTGNGDNNTQGEKRIEWTEESVFELSPKGLRTVYWKKNSTGAEQESWDMKYDWGTNSVDFIHENRETGKKSEKKLTYKGQNVSGDAMYWVLRGFPFEKGKGFEYSAEVILSDGMVLGGRVIHHGEETLDTPFGKIETYKLQLKPTGLVGVVAPKMYMWYTKAAPHAWVRSDGRDDGFTNPRTMNVLLKYSPADWIK